MQPCLYQMHCWIPAGVSAYPSVRRPGAGCIVVTGAPRASHIAAAGASRNCSKGSCKGNPIWTGAHNKGETCGLWYYKGLQRWYYSPCGACQNNEKMNCCGDKNDGNGGTCGGCTNKIHGKYIVGDTVPISCPTHTSD